MQGYYLVVFSMKNRETKVYFTFLVKVVFVVLYKLEIITMHLAFTHNRNVL